MLITVLRISVVLALLLLGGCDGHLVTLNIRDQPAADGRSHRRDLYTCDGQTTLETIQSIAQSLNLASYEVASDNRYTWRSQDGNRQFILGLEALGDGRWKVSLMDWPSNQQSQLSSRAEAEIRNSLTKKCPRRLR